MTEQHAVWSGHRCGGSAAATVDCSGRVKTSAELQYSAARATPNSQHRSFYLNTSTDAGLEQFPVHVLTRSSRGRR